MEAPHTFNQDLAVRKDGDLFFTVMQYNVDQADREEQFNATKWCVREGRVKALIEEVNADLCFFQEFRRLPGVINTTEHFLASILGGYRFIVEFRNPAPMSFGQVIMYKSDKFYHLETKKWWLSDTPNELSDTWSVNAGEEHGYGFILTGVKLQPVHDGKVIVNAAPFWAFNTHFSLNEDVKNRSVDTVVKAIKSVTVHPDGRFDDYILAGDFNFFPPDQTGKRTCHGNEQRQRLMKDGKLQDLGKGAVTLKGVHSEGTFWGYAHDKYHSTWPNNMNARLDHVFASERFIGCKPVLYTKTMLKHEPEEFMTRDYPSDHLPLVVNITRKGHTTAEDSEQKCEL